jgi:uncharacterized protein
MIGTGTLVNAAAVVIGSLLGLLFRKALPERVVDAVMKVMALFTIFLGIKMALGTQELLLLIFSLVLGTITGEVLNLESRLERLSEKIKSRGSFGGSSTFSEGFITAFLLFCMGSMTILGAIEEGLGKNPDLLYTKSMMDGFSSMALASALGVGVLFSSLPLLVYQGALTFFAYWLQHHLNPGLISEISATGGILLIGLGISISGIQKVRVINMIPALVFIVVLYVLFQV